ncbi:YwaF family protein [Robertmurraya kyonggiensis]|uniref:TIGR02206 family membrane protein n=1 Tax=Robertmurraya kyonggiensis TaxID=1037680 RepID=A0A4U1D893_9BACI|nr:TIGR02206 family membrane protein [Robertmurraya kyonggiensis]TKC18785.1 TIGR02206 family membrane protein [Robertmurraya kyonggiensis]
MSQFFGHQYELYPFQLFSVTHLVMLILFVAGSVLLYVFRKPLKSLEKPMKVIMFSGLFILELFYHIWLYSGKAWEISFTLPLQLCSISLLLCLGLLATDSKLLFQIVYFLGIAGAIQALLTPDLFVGFPHFRFLQFFITHMLIIWVALFYAIVKGFRITGKGLWSAFAFLNLAAGVAFLANVITGGNYMFLARKPSNPSLLDYLGPYPYYILVLECLALLLFWLIYLPWRGGRK